MFQCGVKIYRTISPFLSHLHSFYLFFCDVCESWMKRIPFLSATKYWATTGHYIIATLTYLTYSQPTDWLWIFEVTTEFFPCPRLIAAISCTGNLIHKKHFFGFLEFFSHMCRVVIHFIYLFFWDLLQILF